MTRLRRRTPRSAGLLAALATAMLIGASAARADTGPTLHVDQQDPDWSTLDFNAYVTGAPPGTCFYADDAAIALR